MVFGLPESSRYLYNNGRNQEALRVLCDVYDRSPDHPKVRKEQTEVLEAIEIENRAGKRS